MKGQQGLTTGFIFMGLALFLFSAAAQAVIYSRPPANEVSLYYTPPPPCPHKARHKVHHHPPHRAGHHQLVYRHKARQLGNLYVYYVLPATACCGEKRVLPKANCCARSGEWRTSYYATFKPGPEDFSYSATNDDDTRAYDMYQDQVSNESAGDLGGK